MAWCNPINSWEAENEMHQKCKSLIKTTAPGVYTPASLKQTGPLHERGRNAANFITIANLCVFALLAGGKPLDGREEPLTILMNMSDRKEAKAIEPLPPLLERIDKLKDKGNEYFRANETMKALTMYLYGMLDLYPWTANAFLFTAEDGLKYGVVQIEQALWLNLGIASLKLYRAHIHDRWLNNARDCTEAVINMRLATYKQLEKAYSRLSEIGKLMNPGPYPPITPDMSPMQAAEIFANDTVTKFTLATVMIQRASAQANDGTVASAASTCAHKNCIVSHTGCGLMARLSRADTKPNILELQIDGETDSILTLDFSDGL